MGPANIGELSTTVRELRFLLSCQGEISNLDKPDVLWLHEDASIWPVAVRLSFIE
jgi:hypothetical protein